MSFQRHALVCSLLVGIAKHAPHEALTTMLHVVRTWLSSEEPTLMKQAYRLVSVAYVRALGRKFRLLGKIASRLDEPDLWSFFNENLEFAAELVRHSTKDAVPVLLRIRLYHWVSY